MQEVVGSIPSGSTIFFVAQIWLAQEVDFLNVT